jgi:hypothetical protein
MCSISSSQLIIESLHGYIYINQPRRLTSIERTKNQPTSYSHHYDAHPMLYMPAALPDAISADVLAALPTIIFAVLPADDVLSADTKTSILFPRTRQKLPARTVINYGNI